MRVLIFGLNFAPELTGIGRYTGELAGLMASVGHEVRVLAAPPHYPQWRVWPGFSAVRYTTESVQVALQQPTREGSLQVTRCPVYVPVRPGAIRRILHLASFALTSIIPATRMLGWRPDVVLSIEPPLFAAPVALGVATLCGAASVLHVQDFEVDAALELGIIRLPWLRGFLLLFERLVATRFDVVSTISERMVERLVRKGIARERTRLFPNWVDEEQIRPIARGMASRSRFALPENKWIALYAGSIGRKQGLEIVIDAARCLGHRNDLLFVIAGEGPGRSQLEGLATDLTNVRFMDLQPESVLNEFLNSADVHLLPQRPEAADLVLPSKLLGMMASGRPVVATAVPGTQLYGHVENRGFAVPPGDARAFADAVVRLCDSPHLSAEFGASARAHVEAMFGRRRVLDDWLQFMERLCHKVEGSAESTPP